MKTIGFEQTHSPIPELVEAQFQVWRIIISPIEMFRQSLINCIVTLNSLNTSLQYLNWTNNELLSLKLVSNKEQKIKYMGQRYIQNPLGPPGAW